MKKNRIITPFRNRAGLRQAVFLVMAFISLQSGYARGPEGEIFSFREKINAPYPGVIVKYITGTAFGSEQRIFIVEIDTARFGFHIVQREKRQRVRKAARQAGALTAINGGFFVTGIKEAATVDFILTSESSDGNFFGTNRRAAFTIDKTGIPDFTLFDRTREDSARAYSFSEVLFSSPMLIRNGENRRPDLFTGEERHPRSVIGRKSYGTIVMIAIDGRRKKRAGMTLPETAAFAEYLELTDALNLDGGGSTTLWTRKNGILNKPSDRILFLSIPRKVANSIVVLSR